MKLSHVFLSALIGAVVALGAMQFFPAPSGAPAAAKESAFERVMRTNTLRCGYGVAAPWFSVDPNSGAKSGYAFDVTEAIAKKLGLKVVWAEETGWGTAEEGLTSGRYDMMCGPVCVDPRRTRAATFSDPMLSTPLLAVTKPGDMRSLADLNKPEVKIAVKRGEITENIADARFPLAQKVYIADLANESELMLNITAGKADITFTGPNIMAEYNSHNEQKLATGEPVHYCNAAFMVPLGDTKLAHSINMALMELNTDGALEAIAQKTLKQEANRAKPPRYPFR